MENYRGPFSSTRGCQWYVTGMPGRPRASMMAVACAHRVDGPHAGEISRKGRRGTSSNNWLV
jgi:hypothetical protein